MESRDSGAANARQVGGDHYKGGIEHWDLVVANNIPYLEAQIIKYVMRWRKKNGMEDLAKARHFLDKLMEVNADVDGSIYMVVEERRHAHRDEPEGKCPECGLFLDNGVCDKCGVQV